MPTKKKAPAKAKRQPAKAKKRPTKPAKSAQRRTTSKDYVFTVYGNDPAYMAVADVNTYEGEDPDWDYDSLTGMVTNEMNKGHIVAWGCPEQDLRVRLTTTPLDESPNATMTATLDVTGPLALCNYTSLTQNADGDGFPQPDDSSFKIPKGKYRVDVHRLFNHRDGAQFADDEELPKGDHYVVTFTSLAKPTKKHTWVPWALR